MIGQIAQVQAVVCNHYGLPLSAMKASGRHNAWQRQVAMFLARSLTDKSLPQIGKAFGNRDHSTILYSVRKIEKQARADESVAAVLTMLGYRALLQLKGLAA